jgi:UDP-3-O-[3-hydroxymyristoyl] glucosamine N-acyltransferase
MSEPIFFRTHGPIALAAIAELTGSELPQGGGDVVVSGAKPLDIAGPEDLTFCDSADYLGALAETDAAACFVGTKLADKVPVHVVRLVTPQPYVAFVKAARALYPDDLRPLSIFGVRGIDPGASVHEDARLGQRRRRSRRRGGPGGNRRRQHPRERGDRSNVRIGRDCSISPARAFRTR